MDEQNTASTFRKIAVAGILLIAGSTGCTSLKLPEFNAGAFGSQKSPVYEHSDPTGAWGTSDAEQAYHAVRQAKNQQAIVLHLPGAKKPIRLIPLPQNGQTVYVSSLLTQAGVSDKLGPVDATLFRASSESIGGLRMDVKMASNGREVRPESDYALRPGDRLVVVKALSPAMRDIVDTVLGR